MSFLLPRICLVCNRNESKYMCPKCRIPYCCLKCYQKHNIQCTEEFAKEMIIDTLKGQKTNNSSDKKAILDILKHDMESKEEKEKETLKEEKYKILINLASKDDITENMLPPFLLSSFKRDLADGTLGKIIYSGQYWWDSSIIEPYEQKPQKSSYGQYIDFDTQKPWKEVIPNRSIVKSIDKEQISILHHYNSIIPHFSVFLKGKSHSPLLPFNLINILFSYVYVYRFYNNDWSCEPEMSFSSILKLSSVLNDNKVYNSLDEVVSDTLSCSIHCPFVQSIDFSLSMLRHVCVILYDQEKILSVLIYLLNLIDQCLNLLEKEKKTLKKIQMKLNFYYSWVRDSNNEPDMCHVANSLVDVWSLQCLKRESEIEINKKIHH